MTNTKFRRRALVSSVAMLLVALIALGSATFAWFSATNTADANGLNSGTVKATNLLIKEDEGDTFKASFTFKTGSGKYSNITGANPVTTQDLSTWYTVSADEYNKGVTSKAYPSGYTSLSSPAYAGNVAHGNVYAIYGNAGDTGTATLKVKLAYNDSAEGATDALKYVRVGIAQDADTYADATITGYTNKIIGQAKDDFAKAPASMSLTTAATSEQTGTTTLLSEASGSSYLTLGTISKGVVYAFEVYLYFEGTDKDCVDTLSGLSLSDVNITFFADET